jgi:hypothetical protein
MNYSYDRRTAATKEQVQKWVTKPPVRFTRWKEASRLPFKWMLAGWHNKPLDMSVVVHTGSIDSGEFYAQIAPGYSFHSGAAGGTRNVKFSTEKAARREAKKMMANPIAYTVNVAKVPIDKVIGFLATRKL